MTLARELSRHIALSKTDFGGFVDLVRFVDEHEAELVAGLEGREAVTNRARELSIMVAKLLGGGSEWFSRVGDDFYVDPKIAGDELQRRKTDAQITKRAFVRGNMAALTPEKHHV